LRGGTEREYSSLEFSHTGDLIASVGNAPDYGLTVWDWQRERVILRTKAFSQDVFRVTFSPVNEGRLVTSGSGHIRFWKMAHTFTGLKLQGEMGKFGTVDLSDISGYIELPDGKVSSTRTHPSQPPARAVAPGQAPTLTSTPTLGPHSHPGDLDDGDRPAARVGGRPHQD
jgi:WD40 repeat protein